MFFLSQILFASNDSLFNLIDKAIIEGKTSVAQKLIDENITRANNFQKANLLYLEGKLNAYQSNYSKAIECAYQSKKIALQNNFNEVVFKNDYLLGKTFQIIGNNNKAKEYFNQALSYPQDRLTKVKILYNLSLIETDSTKSFELIQKSVELLEYIDENTLFALEIQARFAYFKSDYCVN